MTSPHITLVCEGETVQLVPSLYLNKNILKNNITIQYTEDGRLWFDTDRRLSGNYRHNAGFFKECDIDENFISCEYEKKLWANEFPVTASITIDRKSGGAQYFYDSDSDIVQAKVTCDLAKENKF